jgi:hypothetical protein
VLVELAKRAREAWALIVEDLVTAVASVVRRDRVSPTMLRRWADVRSSARHDD